MKWPGLLRGLMFCCLHAGKKDLALKLQLVSFRCLLCIALQRNSRQLGNNLVRTKGSTLGFRGLKLVRWARIVESGLALVGARFSKLPKTFVVISRIF